MGLGTVMTSWVNKTDRVIKGVGVSVMLLGIGRVRNDGIGRNESSQPRGIVPGIVINKAKVTVVFLAGEVAVGDGLGRGYATIAAKGA